MKQFRAPGRTQLLLAGGFVVSLGGVVLLGHYGKLPDPGVSIVELFKWFAIALGFGGGLAKASDAVATALESRRDPS